ncbi:MAG: hypothetical protein AAF430_15615 [Myxococcota bacterium]
MSFRGLEVAGLRMAIEVPDALPWEWPDGPLLRFASTPEDADVRVRVAVRDRLEAPPRAALAYDSEGGIFDVARVDDGWVFSLAVRGELLRVARFDAEFQNGVVEVAADSFYVREVLYPLAYPLDELIYLHRLARCGGLLLHACGVARGERARLYTGRSGAGKTTVARLELGRGDCEVLSDDRIVLWKRPDSGFEVCGTPWHGDAPLASRRRVRLASIHAIHQAGSLEAAPLAGAAAAAAVLGNAFLPAHDPIAAARTLDLVDELVREVPIGDLHFPKAPSVVPYAWRQPAAASA